MNVRVGAGLAPSASGPLFPNLRYCTRCCMPETAEGLAFDELGICQPCRSSEQKIHINWVEREKRLGEILERYKGKSPSGYDCLVPISGGKDSMYQLYILTQKYGLKPLACTFSHNLYSQTGLHNLRVCIESFGTDHVMITPSKALVAKLAKESLYRIGDPCWHCHAGVGAYPLQVAVQYEIPLLVWGESVAENHGTATYENPIVFDREYFTRVSARYYAEEMVGGDLTRDELRPFILPTYPEIERVGVVGIHMGDYIFWDGEKQMEFLKREFGWREDKVEGTYKGYKSVECRMPGLHDWTKFLKRGFGRSTDHVSLDVRAGLLTRDEGFALAREHDPVRPAILDEFLEMTGLTEEEFHRVMRAHRQETMGQKNCSSCESCGHFPLPT